MFSHSEAGGKPKGHAGSRALRFSRGTAPGRGQVGKIFMATHTEGNFHGQESSDGQWRE